MALTFSPDHLPEGRPGRLLAVGVTLLLLLSAWLLISGLLDLHAREQMAIADRQQMLIRTQALVDSIPSLQERYETASRSAHGDTLLLTESSRETALARLQEIVHDTAHSVQVEPSSMEPLPVVRNGPFEHLGVRLSLTTSWNTLVHLLNTLSENASPRLLIDDLQIQVAGTSSLEDEATKGRMVDASLTILALRDPRPAVATATDRP